MAHKKYIYTVLAVWAVILGFLIQGNTVHTLHESISSVSTASSSFQQDNKHANGQLQQLLLVEFFKVDEGDIDELDISFPELFFSTNTFGFTPSIYTKITDQVIQIQQQIFSEILHKIFIEILQIKI